MEEVNLLEEDIEDVENKYDVDMDKFGDSAVTELLDEDGAVKEEAVVIDLNGLGVKRVIDEVSQAPVDHATALSLKFGQDGTSFNVKERHYLKLIQKKLEEDIREAT